MSSYRFCRTDDIGLLVDALNRCWLPHFPGEEPMTPAAFKRSIRDLQVWCSSCMVAFAGGDPIAVLIGAKRPTGTLIHKIAVHPDHLRQGHGRHLLTSLSSKLAILGPPRMVAEVPEAFAAARGLFEACGFIEEAVLSDYALDAHADRRRPDVSAAHRTPHVAAESFVIPLTVGDLAANGLLGEGYPQACWKRSVETLTARQEEITGVAVASEDRIEAYVLYIEDEILAFRSLVEDGFAGARQLLPHLGSAVRIAKVHPKEIPPDMLGTLGFRPFGSHLLYAARA